MAVDLPLIDTAPFWRLATPEAFGAIVGDMPPPGALDLAAGWTLAFYSVAQTDAARSARPRAPAWGWVKGCFAVSDAPFGDGLFGALTHLPIGARLCDFLDAEQAAEAADLIAPIADWPSVTLTSARTIRPFSVWSAAGFQRLMLRDGDAAMIVLARTMPGGLH